MQGVHRLCYLSIPVLIVNKPSSHIHSKTATVKTVDDKLDCLALVFSLSG